MDFLEILILFFGFSVFLLVFFPLLFLECTETCKIEQQLAIMSNFLPFFLLERNASNAVKKHSRWTFLKQ